MHFRALNRSWWNDCLRRWCKLVSEKQEQEKKFKGLRYNISAKNNNGSFLIVTMAKKIEFQNLSNSDLKTNELDSVFLETGSNCALSMKNILEKEFNG